MMNRAFQRSASSLIATLVVLPLFMSSSAHAAELAGAELNDADLAQVSAGSYDLTLDGFDINIANNEAGQFTFDIAQSAFANAQGIFTTLQTVNSAVDLTVIVNIYMGN